MCALAAAVVDQLLQLFAIYAIALIVDASVSRNESAALRAGMALSVSVGLSYLLNSIGARLSNQLRERTAMAFELQLIALLGSLPGIEHFERPNLLNRVDDVRQNRWALGGAAQAALSAITVSIQLIGTAILLFRISPALLALPIVGGGPLLAAFYGDRVMKRTEENTAEDLRLASRLQSSVLDPAAAPDLRLHGFGPSVLNRHRSAGNCALAFRRRGLALTGMVSIAGDIIMLAGQVAALALVSVSAWRGDASPGDVALTIALTLRLRGQVSGVVGVLNWFFGALRTVERFLWVSEEVAQVTPSDEERRTPERIVDGIRLESIGFTYPGADRSVLKGVDLVLPPASTVAIVGENGAGKSTIVKLLTRFYEPTEGRVTIDGVDLRQLSLEDWRRRLTGSFQDCARFEFLARHTVGIGDIPQTEDDGTVLSAIDAAGAGCVLGSLPHGLDTQLGTRFEEGVDLSGGQWQQLALSRAMMRRTPLVMLLDEPTASLDAGTEFRLFERYAAAARRVAAETGAITVLVSHRFSTVRMADLIVVMSEGRVVERGSHEELVRQGGLYADLYTLQARGYK